MIGMRCWRRIALGALFCGAPFQAAQACELRWAQFSPSDAYDATSFQALPVHLEVGFEDEEACASASISVAPTTDMVGVVRGIRGAKLYGQGGWALNLVAPSGEISARRSINPRRAMKGGGGRMLPLFQVSPHQFVPSGRYAQSFQILIDGQPQSAFEPELQVVVAPVAVFRTTGAPLKINFGALGASGQGAQLNNETADRGSIQFLYQATNSAVMMVTSDHGGRLVHDLGVDFTPIKYQVAINGATMPFGIGQEVDLLPGAGGTGLIEVFLEKIGDRYAGKYSDNLIISIVSNN